MSQHVEQAVAVVIRKVDEPSLVLVVRRPDTPEEELPDIWGLPATSLRPGETFDDALRRLGRSKLGAVLTPGDCLLEGDQTRGDHVLHMYLYEAMIAPPEPQLPLPSVGEPGVTYYTAWRWSDPITLVEGARKGSLCSKLLLQYLRVEAG